MVFPDNNPFKLGRKFFCVYSGVSVTMQAGDEVVISDDEADIRLLRTVYFGERMFSRKYEVYWLKFEGREALLLDDEISKVITDWINCYIPQESDEQGFQFVPFYEKLSCQSDRFHAYAHAGESRINITTRKEWNAKGGYKRETYRQRMISQRRCISEMQNLGF